MLKHEGGELHKIIERNKSQKKSQDAIVTIINQTASLNISQPIGRNLQEFTIGDDVQAICEALDQDGCESDDRCSWCKSGAVPDKCNSVDAAKVLPSSIF